MKIGIVAGARTPFVKAGLDFDAIGAETLGTVAAAETLNQSGISVAEVDEVVFGNVAQPMNATNIARVIALNAGLPLTISAHTVQRNCASGMQAITTGVELIRSGSAHTVLTGGTESMSNIPLLFPKSFVHFLGNLSKAKSPLQKLDVLATFRLSHLKPTIALLEGLKDPFCGLNMGQTAEVLAKEYGITREEQDAFALQSHQKACQALDILKEEIVPVFAPKLNRLISQDVGPRKEQTLQALQKLKPYFDKKYGSVTVGNSCPVTDGAASLLIMSESKIQSHGLKPLAWIRSYAFAGVDPKRMGLGPVLSSSIALEKAGLTVKDLGLIEINEAFAAQVLSVLKCFASRELSEKLGARPTLSEIDPRLLNVNGGAIALGHPVGTSGARIVLTLAKEMKRRKVQFGLSTLCVGGGLGGAVVLENASL